MSAIPSAWRAISAPLRGVSENRLPTYLSTDLAEDVELSVRIN